MSSAKGFSLHIGLNSVDPNHYAGWSGELNACEADATDMAALVSDQGFSSKILLTKQATRDNVYRAIDDISKTLVAGDIFCLSYSGHGGQLPDLSGDETDFYDETWCLYDGELVDDEIYALLGKFAPGVRILSFSDSCHSGTVLKAAFYSQKSDFDPNIEKTENTYRAMPSQIALRTYKKNKEFYDPILKRKSPDKEEMIRSTAILISGCQDNQLSSDGTFNGLFTGTLLKVWANGRYRGKTYSKFCRDIVEHMPPDQTPNLYIVGAENKRFEKERPFTV